MPGFGSGIAAQSGFAAETTVGTAVTPDHFFEHDEAKMDLNLNWAEGVGLHAGGQYKRASREVQTSHDATGTWTGDVTNKKFGFLFKYCMGSAVTTPTQIATTTAYKQVHQPGNDVGMSMTLQIGVPQTDGTVVPFTYPGVKVMDWTLSGKEKELLKLQMTLDASDELTTASTPAGLALAAASYPTSSLFAFSSLGATGLKIGGTAATTSGVVAITGGAAPTSLIKSFDLKTTTPRAKERYGTSLSKREQLQNGFTTTVLTLDAEFGSRAEFYDIFRAGTIVPIQMTFTGAAIGVSGSNDTIDIVIPAAKIKKGTPQGNGQDLTNLPLELEVLDDQTNPVMQITYISADTTL